MAGSIGNTHLDRRYTLIQTCCLLCSTPAAGLLISKRTGRGTATEKMCSLEARIRWSVKAFNSPPFYACQLLCSSPRNKRNNWTENRPENGNNEISMSSFP